MNMNIDLFTSNEVKPKIIKNIFYSHLFRRISKKPMRSDAEASLMGHNQNKFNDTKHISNKKSVA